MRGLSGMEMGGRSGRDEKQKKKNAKRRQDTACNVGKPLPIQYTCHDATDREERPKRLKEGSHYGCVS